VIRFRARVQATLWTLSHLPYFALAILLAMRWLLDCAGIALGFVK
jgi:hypothetical protein